jgi:leucyl/phenylalanyl-tRNA--protein transferase
MPDSETDEILWYNPDPRTVIPLDGFHKSRSLTRTVKKRVFEVTFDQDFIGVIQGCASREPTWISNEIKAAYIGLFKLGYCHSVEVRGAGGTLVGGLYGISQGGVFNAESMFSREKDASKVALWALTDRMRQCGLTLLEVQFMTEHLRSLGAIEIQKAEYLRQLGIALSLPVGFTPVVGAFNLL